jgi:hypothetical protein
MTKPPLADVPIRSAEELTRRWGLLLHPPAFSARSLWLVWLDDGLMLPVVIPVDDVPAAPDRPLLANLAGVCQSVAEAHVAGTGHLAMALCRPGRPVPSRDDDAWVEGLRDAFEQSSLTWSLHLAASGSVVPMIDLPA